MLCVYAHVVWIITIPSRAAAKWCPHLPFDLDTASSSLPEFGNPEDG